MNDKLSKQERKYIDRVNNNKMKLSTIMRIQAFAVNFCYFALAAMGALVIYIVFVVKESPRPYHIFILLCCLCFSIAFFLAIRNGQRIINKHRSLINKK